MAQSNVSIFLDNDKILLHIARSIFLAFRPTFRVDAFSTAVYAFYNNYYASPKFERDKVSWWYLDAVSNQTNDLELWRLMF